MVRTDAKKNRGVEHEPVPPSEKESRSHHHVELVVARIIAKQHANAKQKSFHLIDWENESTD